MTALRCALATFFLLSAPALPVSLGGARASVEPQCKLIIGGHGYSNTINLWGSAYQHLMGGRGCAWSDGAIGSGQGALINLDSALDDWTDATDTCGDSSPGSPCLVHVRNLHTRMAAEEPGVLVLQVVWTGGQTPVSATHDTTDQTRLIRYIDFMLDEADEHYGTVPEVWCMTPVPYSGTNDCNGYQTPGEFEVYDRAVSLCEWCRDTDGTCDRVIDMGGVSVDEDDHWYEDECHQDWPQRMEEARELRDQIEATGVVYGAQ